MRGSIRKVLGLGLLGILLATPVLLAQRTGAGGRKGGSNPMAQSLQTPSQAVVLNFRP